MRSRRIARVFALIFIIGPIAILVFGGIVMWLWNNVLVPVMHVSTVTFWQALGLLVLAKILFGSFSGGKNRSRYDRAKRRMMWDHMTPEQREKFKEEWRVRCGDWRSRYRTARTGEGPATAEG
jgi:hypothetical protein